MKFYNFLVVGVLLFCFSNIVQAESLTMLTLHNPPLEYKENESARGIAVDLVNEAVKRTGKDVIIKFSPWKRAQAEVEHGKADACFNTGNTEWRRKWAYFNDEVLINETYVLFISKKANFRVSEINDHNVRNIKVGVQRGYAYGGSFQKALDHKWFKRIDVAESIEQNIQKLIHGRLDIFVGDLLPSKYYLKQAGILDKVEIVKKKDSDEKFIASVWPTYVAFSKKRINKKYVEEFNKALVTMKKDGTYQKLIDKYLE